MINQSNRRLKVMRNYIEVTRNMLEEYGYEKISVRKIADEIGYNSTNMYKYFENLDTLFLYSSISFLREYILELRSELKSITTDSELIYIKVYEIFAKHSFRNPEVYFNMFYGPKSHLLVNIIKNYYELFPEDLEGDFGDDIANMLAEGSIEKRDFELTRPLLKEGILSEEQVNYLIYIVPRIHSTYLYKLLYVDEELANTYLEEFIAFLHKTIFLLKRR